MLPTGSGQSLVRHEQKQLSILPWRGLVAQHARVAVHLYGETQATPAHLRW